MTAQHSTGVTARHSTGRDRKRHRRVPAGSRPEDVLPLDETWSFIRPSVPEPEMVRGRAKVYARGPFFSLAKNKKIETQTNKAKHFELCRDVVIL